MGLKLTFTSALTAAAQFVIAATAALAVTTAAGATAADTLNLNASLALSWQFNEPCPPGVPNRGQGCDHATGTVRIRGLGTTAGEEYMSFDPATVRRDGGGAATFTVGSRGTISFSFSGNFRTATYTVTGGTGAFAGASGTGTINGVDLELGGPNVAQSWSGTLNAPATHFDTTPPQLSIGKAKVKRAGAHRYRIKIPFRASDDSGGPIDYELVVRGGTKVVKASGSGASAIGVSVATRPKTRRLLGALTVYDASANPATRSFRIRLPR